MINTESMNNPNVLTETTVARDAFACVITVGLKSRSRDPMEGRDNTRVSLEKVV